MSEQQVRFVPIRRNILWHIAMDTAVAEHAYDRTPLCGRVQGEFHVRTTPTSRWGAKRLSEQGPSLFDATQEALVR